MPEKYYANIKYWKADFSSRDIEYKSVFLAGVSILPFGVFTGYASRYYVMRGTQLDYLVFQSIGSFLRRLVAILIVITPAMATFYITYVHKHVIKPIGSTIIGMAMPFWMLIFGMYGGFAEYIATSNCC